MGENGQVSPPVMLTVPPDRDPPTVQQASAPSVSGSSTDGAHRPVVAVRRVGPDIADAVAEFFRAVWDEHATGEKVRAASAAAAAQNPVEPGVDVPSVVFLSDGKVLGYLGTIPVSFWNGRSETPTYWLKGFMVLPEHRNGPVGFNLLKEALKIVGPTGAIAAAPAARRLFTALGLVECGQIPNYITVLRPARVLSSLDIGALGMTLPGWMSRALTLAQRTGLAALGGAIGGLGLGGWRGVRGGGGRDCRIQSGGSLPPREELDALWYRTRATIAAAAVRDGTYLPWRYEPGPGKTYEAVAVRDQAGTLDAVAIVKQPRAEGDERLRGIKVATLSDLLFPTDRPDAGLAALAGAERVARRMGADAILCSATHPAVTTLLPRRAYVRMPGNIYFLIRDPKRALEFPTALDAWWVTRGDDGSDETF